MRKSLKNKFIEVLNEKKYCELNLNFKNMVKGMFPSVKNQDLILCQSYNGVKVDLIIQVNNIKKNLSIKNKNTICVYKGDVKRLISFMFSIGLSYNCISSLLSYQYSDYTTDGSGRTLNSFGLLLEDDFKNEIKIVREEFDDFKICELIDFLLVREKNGLCVDFFYFGNIKYGEIIETSELIKNILKRKGENNKFMKLGPFNFISLSRCDNYISNNQNKYKCMLKINLSKYKK